MAKPKVTTNTHLPIRPVLTVFFIVLASVALMAAIAGENQKINITGRKLMTRIAARNFQDAYNLLTEDAKKRTTEKEVRAKLALLRTYARLKYGPDFNEEYAYYFEAPFWLPWRGDNVRPLSIGFYKKGKDMKSQFIAFFNTPPLEGPLIKDFLVVSRDEGSWKILEIKFDPEKHLGELEDPHKKSLTLFTPTENGFIIDGFVYDRRAITPEQRSYMLDAIKQAVHELETDSGKKNSPDNGFMKMIP